MRISPSVELFIVVRVLKETKKQRYSFLRKAEFTGIRPSSVGYRQGVLANRPRGKGGGGVCVWSTR